MLVAGLVAVLLSGCGDGGAAGRRLEGELLSRERDALRRRLAEPAVSSRPDVVVAVPAGVVRELISTDLPFEAAVDRFRITVREADVDFRGGLALIRLGGSVRWVDREDVEADLGLVGTLEVLDVDGPGGSLRARMDILGIQTRDVRVGDLSPPAERLLDALARRPAEELEALVREIEIPVRVLRSVELPAVEEEEVSIAAAAVPLEVSVQAVAVGGDLMVVELAVGVPRSPEAETPSPAEPAPEDGGGSR